MAKNKKNSTKKQRKIDAFEMYMNSDEVQDSLLANSVEALYQYIAGDVKDVDQVTANLLSTKITGIEGIPYQFMGSVDRRIGTQAGQGVNEVNKLDGVGRKYAEKVFSRMPLLWLTPCEPVFMGDFNAEENKDVIDAMISVVTGINTFSDETKSSLQSLLTKQGKYYTTEVNYDTYYNALNTMLTCLVYYMGLGDVKIPIKGKMTELKKVSWDKELNEDFKKFYSSRENLIFYLDGLNQVSETFSNDTTDSSLANTINGMADQINELNFLFGKNNTNLASTLMNQAGELGSQITAAVSEMGQGLAGGIVESLLEYSPMLAGGKVVFPKIWNNSSFNRSYSLDIKLRSPDHDNLSIFLNILKPYCKLLALVLPRPVYRNVKEGVFKHKNLEEDINSFTSPMLVRAAVKGMFSIDMGMITDMSVTKGAECCWNDDGLPTQIDISITIEDLYSSMHMSSVTDDSILGVSDVMSGRIHQIVSNTTYQDFLANAAGLNIAQMNDFTKKFDLSRYLLENRFNNAGNSINRKLDNFISKKINTIYNWAAR